MLRKVVRILTYYARLASYVPRSQAQIFHLLWNNKFEHFDRTALMLYYRLFGKRVVFTAHNVNARKRDGCDSWLNRFTLRIQYRLCTHILVHTAAMKRELLADFEIAPERVSVIPFGINDTNPRTGLGRGEARERLGLRQGDKALLFFGQIAPYKGLNYLVGALAELATEGRDFQVDCRRPSQAGTLELLGQDQVRNCTGPPHGIRDSTRPIYPGRRGRGVFQGGGRDRDSLRKNFPERGAFFELQLRTPGDRDRCGFAPGRHHRTREPDSLAGPRIRPIWRGRFATTF